MKSRTFLFFAACVFATTAQAADWPRFLGPNDDCSSPETGLLKTWTAAGPEKLWEVEKGAGYACPAIVGEMCVIFHGADGREVIEGLSAATGEKKWKHDYAAPFTPQYGAGDGSRSSPVIAAGKVYVSGVAGDLHCLELATGKVVWHRELAKDYKLSPTFFGRGGSPLVMDGKLIVSLGTEDGKSLVALDPTNGRELWTAKSPWGVSYASPIPAKLHERSCVLAFQGGMDEPPTGGLLVVDATDGRVITSVPHRAKMWASVNVSSPVVAGNRVFVAEAYTEGGLCVEIAKDFTAKALWHAKKFDTYLMTAVHHEGMLYGFVGMRQQMAELVCHEVATGKELWREDLGGKFQRGSLLRVDGAFLALGENGDLAWLSLDASGPKVLAQAKLFNAGETWTLPALADGRLFVCQNQPGAGGTKQRVICYELREKPRAN
jgi:outer membrane protein assembly factor BamB